MKMIPYTLLVITMISSCNHKNNDPIDDDPDMNTATVQYFMPAESAPHEGTWLQWPQKYQYGESYRDHLEPTWIEMTRELVSGEKVHIIAYNEEAKQEIQSTLTANQIPQRSE